MALFSKIIKGSTKDMRVLGDEMIFHFSDRFSLFDYGAFPFEIPKKGEGQKLFATTLDSAMKKKFKTAYTSYQPLTQKYYSSEQFIPLEFIFRWGVVPGSSYLKRHPELDNYATFSSPVVEITTKLEAKDRLLSFEEAAHLSPHPIKMLVSEVVPSLAQELKFLFSRANYQLVDGKFEFAYANGEYVLIDAITQDELRFSYKKLECSKELLRRAYRQSSWYQEEKMQGVPPKLNDAFIQLIGDIYCQSAEQLQNPNRVNEEKLQHLLSLYEDSLCHAF